ncbi:uncharacterized protein LOC127791623 [Diospyros lotus]|uniref:uncharacterized protein LOC127791623 n=1 Tax=Diospyros lotus TaxID=55363 RepID=UPI00224E1924|nr:uncharacterized protein LOC127791623 [Diospyros lotus]
MQERQLLLLKGEDGIMVKEEEIEEPNELEGEDNGEIFLHALKGLANNKIIKVEGKEMQGESFEADLRLLKLGDCDIMLGLDWMKQVSLISFDLNRMHDIEKFDGQNDFALWKMKISTLLGNIGLEEALEGESKMPKTYTKEQKKDILKKAYNMVILSLDDKVLREVSKMKTATEIWLKLESLHDKVPFQPSLPKGYVLYF